jgi:hypothetical protein
LGAFFPNTGRRDAGEQDFSFDLGTIALNRAPYPVTDQ